jgi:subtilisin family serine protease
MPDAINKKLDPLLQARATTPAPSTLGAESLEPPVRLLVAFTGSRAELEALGMQIASFADGIATGTLAAHRLAALSADARVIAVEAARPLASEMDLSAASIGATAVQRPPLSLSGRGVIIGIVDTGIDLWHPAFRRTNGRSAVLSLWDQTLRPIAPEQPPTGFGYGVEYSSSQIAVALTAGRTTQALRHRDSHGHGTHVASIAAGSAAPYAGIAPDADLIVVATANDSKALGDSARTLDAIRYVFERAAALGRPAVVNLSLGNYIGPHDGTSLLERGIDRLLSQPGRMLVKAAGNAGGARCHAGGSLAPSQQITLPFDVAPTNEQATIDLWYETVGQFEAVLIDPDGNATPTVSGDELREDFLPHGNRVLISSILGNPANGDNRLYIVIDPSSAPTLRPGRWQLRLQARQNLGSARFDAWIERGNQPPRFAPEVAEERMTVSVPGTAQHVIAVAAYSDRLANRTAAPTARLVDFSSRGPTRDGREQPVIAAPGENIAAARSADSNRTPFGAIEWALLSGTSMAAPHVTGAVALLLQRDPMLSAAHIRARIVAAAHQHSDRDGWGAGRIDLGRLLAQITPQPTTVARPQITVAAGWSPTHPLAFQVMAGADSFFAVEVARDTAFFTSAGLANRRYTDASATTANFFASWRTQPLQSGATYTLPSAAWDALRDAPHLFCRVLTSSSASQWQAVARSLPLSVTLAAVPSVPPHESFTSQPTFERNGNTIMSNTKNTQTENAEPIGAPPADLVAADTTNAAVVVHNTGADLAARAVGVGELVEDTTADNIAQQTIPSSAYGDFVRKVGLAVADAQKALDENSVSAALKLAETNVKTLVAMNQVVNEDGEIETVRAEVQDLPLIAHIQPTFYQFSRVQMFARFDIRDFESDGTTKIQSSRSAFNAGASFRASSGLSALFGGISGGASTNFSSSNSNTQVDSEFNSSSSAGTSFMFAEMRPRTDTRFPAPIIATQGPRLTLSAAANTLPPPAANATSTVDISVTLFKKTGFSSDNKIVDLVLAGPGQLAASTISLTFVPNTNQTRMQGTITLTRRSNDPAGTAVVRATLGTLTSVVSIDFPAPPQP